MIADLMVIHRAIINLLKQVNTELESWECPILTQDENETIYATLIHHHGYTYNPGQIAEGIAYHRTYNTTHMHCLDSRDWRRYVTIVFIEPQYKHSKDAW